jgi:succinyl-CoA synthetase beta subunit
MLLNENEGKALLREFGIPTPAGCRVETTPEFETALSQLGFPVVLKAQIAAGARGKNGGILFASSAGEAREHFGALLGREINGLLVSAILVEQKLDIRKERYIGYIIHDNLITLMVGRDGGVDIEQSAAEDPSSVLLIPIERDIEAAKDDIEAGLRRFQVSPKFFEAYLQLCRNLFAAFVAGDCTMAEINPVAELGDGRLVAVDARIDIDPQALSRQARFGESGEPEASDGKAGSYRAPALHRLHNGGPIGLIGMGGALGLTMIDWLASARAPVSAIVDIDDAIGAGRTKEAVGALLEEIEAIPGTRAILINLISCGYEIDGIAADIVATISQRKGRAKLPLILHFKGNKAPAADRIIHEAGFENCVSLKRAVDLAIHYAQPGVP